MRIFSAFIILIASILLWMMPITTAIHDFQTDLQTNTFTTATAVGITSANTTLTTALFNDDTSSFVISSNISEAPSFSSYNATIRQLTVGTMTANATRTLTVVYDIAAFSGAAALDTFLIWFPYIWYVLIIAFPIVGVAAIITRRD